MKHLKVLPHFCNEPLRCPECVRRFWIWAERHTQGVAASPDTCDPRGGLSFYVAAAKKET